MNLSILFKLMFNVICRLLKMKIQVYCMIEFIMWKKILRILREKKKKLNTVSFLQNSVLFDQFKIENFITS